MSEAPPEGPGRPDDPTAAAGEGLARLETEAQRRDLVRSHPSLLSPEAVAHLCARVGEEVWADLDLAGRMAEAATWLARELADPASQGLAHRARANVALFRRDYTTALAEYRSALEVFRALGDERQQAITRSSGVVGLVQTGRYAEAMQWADQAGAIFRRLGDEVRLARLEVNVGNLLSRRDRYLEAGEHYRSALELFRKAGSPADVSTSLRNIAVNLQMLNDFPGSLEAYEQARQYCEEHGLHKQAVEVEYNIAYLYYLQGEYTRALHLYEKARLSCERLGDAYHTALCDLDLSEIYLELNLVEEAARLAERGFEGFQRLGMDYEAAQTLAWSAIAAHRQGRPDTAMELLGRAHEIFAGELNEVWVAMIDLYRAAVLRAEGRAGEATRFAQSALESFERSRLPGKAALCEILLARLALLEPGRASEAGRLAASARRRIADLGLPTIEYQAHQVAGLAAEALGDPRAAERAYRRSHDQLEKLRGHLQSDELKVAFLEDKLAVYESLVWLALEGRGSRRDPIAAFEWIEKAKSRSLADLLAFGAQTLPSTTGRQDLVQRMRSLRDELSGLYRKVDRLEMQGGRRPQRKIDSLRASIRVGERRLLAALRRLQVDDVEYRSVQDSITFGLETVRESLAPETTLLEYYIARDTVLACVVDRAGLEVERLASAQRIRELHRQLRLQLSKFRLGPDYVTAFKAPLRHATSELLARLYDELLRPVEGRLEADHLVIVGHDFLHHLPFHALFDGEAHLIDRFSVSYAPSATVLHLCSTREADPDDRALVLGVADERAPLIVDEARAVAAALPSSRLLLGEEASREALLRHGRDCRYVHIATHGLYRQDNPMFSAIQLGDTRLSLLDLYSLRLQAELAVLSGCGTGLGAVRGGDELIGLTRGLLYAGARSVLVTLWDVNDESTARYMLGFYRCLTAGQPPAKALRQAVLELRESHPDPYFWAPFVLVGRPSAAAKKPHPELYQTG